MASSLKREQTHARILDVAARALRRDGFAGVGVAGVMKDAGLTHGGFYAHFTSREALLVEAIEHGDAVSGAKLDRRVAVAVAAGANPLAALVSCYLSEEHFAACEAGCVVGALGSEMVRQQAALRDASRARIGRLVGRVRLAMEKSGVGGAELEGRALALAAALVGALQIARTVGPGEPGATMLAMSRQALLEQFAP